MGRGDGGQRRRFLGLCGIGLGVLGAHLAWAAAPVGDSCRPPQAGTLVASEDQVQIKRSNAMAWLPHWPLQDLCHRDTVRTGERGRATLVLPKQNEVKLPPGTVMTVFAPEDGVDASVDLKAGGIYVLSRVARRFKFNTPFLNGINHGTEFLVTVTESETKVIVFEGEVNAENAYGAVRVNPGEEAIARPFSAPIKRLAIRPDDAVAWALEYPPLARFPAATPNLRDALTAFRQSRPVQALTLLDRIPPAERAPSYWKLRAAISIAIGAVDEARSALYEVVHVKADDADAKAIMAVIALAGNRKEEALALANQAVAGDSRSPIALSALSYVEQSRFQLRDALRYAIRATELAPEDGLAWARRAELELSLELRRDATESIAAAQRAEPYLERAWTIAGFAALASGESRSARQAFAKAIELDRTAPLARFGHGLARIRAGDLEEGRQDIEVAVILDPKNSLLRSYLGKAYFEEKRGKLSANQFELAKGFDPKDPTPYFYDAIRKQTENRPVEALRDLQQAIELNDNRAVYRSRELLDADLAIRNSSVSRIYDVLGFSQRGIVDATRTVSMNPTTDSAHRLLADLYSDIPNRDTARLSEALQARVNQRINTAPIQAQYAVQRRGAVPGFGLAPFSFRDYSRAFEANSPHLSATALVGTQESYSHDVTLSGVKDRFSYSLGEFHSETNGFRSNAKAENDIYDIFLQSEFWNDLNIQFEYINRETMLGSIRQDLIEEINLDRSQSTKLNESVYRVASSFDISPKLRVVGVVSDFRRDRRIDVPNTGEIGFVDSGNVGEAQATWLGEHWNMVCGLGLYKFDHSESFRDSFDPSSLDRIQSKVEGENGYCYSNARLGRELWVTLGLNYAHAKLGRSDGRGRLNPKLGFQWDIDKTTRIRFGYVEGFTRNAIVAQTLEPTQVAGFNQVFDDLSANRVFRAYGSGIDFRISTEFFAGFEFTRRDILAKERFNLVDDRRSDRYRSYAYWNPTSYMALTAEYIFQLDRGITPVPSIPFPREHSLATTTLPISVRLFHPSGWFSQGRITPIFQSQIGRNSVGESDLEGAFCLFDFAVGYRLPRRLGVISLEINNVFDERFLFNDRTRFEQGNDFAIIQEFLPTRVIQGRVSLAF